MCRWVVYFGRHVLLKDVLLAPEHSMLGMARDGPYLPGIEATPNFDPELNSKRNHALNGDGYGLGFYQVVPQPAVVKGVTPAWNSMSLQSLAHVITSPLVFGHVRAATTPASISRANSHPFQVGRFMFMHNGAVSSFLRVKQLLVGQLDERLLASIVGSTDSEHAFAVFLCLLAKRKQSFDFLDMRVTVQEMKEVLRDTIRVVLAMCQRVGIKQHHSLNFAVTDGVCVVATRYRDHPTQQAPSLFVAHGHHFGIEWSSPSHPHKPHPQMIDASGPHEKLTAILASEPLTFDQRDWHMVPSNSMVAIYRQPDTEIVSVDTDELPVWTEEQLRETSLDLKGRKRKAGGVGPGGSSKRVKGAGSSAQAAAEAAASVGGGVGGGDDEEEEEE